MTRHAGFQFMAILGMSLWLGSLQSLAQEASAIPGAAAPGTVAPAATTDELDARFQAMVHDYSVSGFDYEILLKLDTYTGKTWRFHASNARWSPIPEKEGEAPLDGGTIARYELIPHAYLDTNGVEQELYLRFDSVSGRTWTYRGSNGSWREIEQDD